MRRIALALIRLALVAALVFGAIQVVASRPAHAATAVTIDGAASCGGSAFCFSPAAVSVASGDTVTWTNQSGAPHTVTRCDAAACNGTDGGTGADPAFDLSVAANNGATANHTFSGAGTYNYYCKIHGFAVMHGTVTVQGGAAATTTTSAAASATSTSTPTPNTVAQTTPTTTAPATAAASAVPGQVNFTG
jgi:plastocyanin